MGKNEKYMTKHGVIANKYNSKSQNLGTYKKSINHTHEYTHEKTSLDIVFVKV
jgi:hypothetical protein